MNFLTELNTKADEVVAELIKAKRAAEAASLRNDLLDNTYQRGRVEELEKWWQSLELLISKVTERLAEQRAARNAVLLDGKRQRVFICDQECECKDSVHCGRECIHTTDPTHAQRFLYTEREDEEE